MAIQFVNKEELEKKLGKGNQIVSFFAEWCGPCKMMAPTFEEISEEVEVFKVNIDENKDFAKEEGIQSIPTTNIFKDGKLVDTIIGFSTKENILSKIVK